MYGIPWYFDKGDPLPCQWGGIAGRGFLNVWLEPGISGVNVTFAWYSRLTILCLHLSNWARIFPLLFIFACVCNEVYEEYTENYTCVVRTQTLIRLRNNERWLRLPKYRNHSMVKTAVKMNKVLDYCLLHSLFIYSSNLYSFILFLRRTWACIRHDTAWIDL